MSDMTTVTGDETAEISLPAQSAPNAARTASGRMRLLGIAPEAYRHPMDAQATRALRTVPGFELAASKVMQYGIEKFLYHEMCASAVKVTPKQCGSIHALLEEACAVLDMPLPALFLSQTPIANAFALGRETPTVVLHTGLVELLTEEELLGVIAHELGHIQCGHSVYRLMALLLLLASKAGGGALGVGDLFSMSFQAALLEWTRKAEFSADRAAILTVQDPEVIFSALFKLTGGSPKVFAQMDRDEYLKQAEEYDQPDGSRLDKFYKVMLESEKSHPIPVLRSREVLRYGETDEYKKIIAGDYLRREKNAPAPGFAAKFFGPAKPATVAPAASAPATVTCPHCGSATDGAFSFCVSCGRDLPRGAVLAPSDTGNGGATNA